MSTEDNKALVNRYFNAAWNQGDPAVIDELFAANFHHHNPGVPNGGSREGFKLFNGVFRSGFSGLRVNQGGGGARGGKGGTPLIARRNPQGEDQGSRITWKRA